jgi:hypothetical protein
LSGFCDQSLSVEEFPFYGKREGREDGGDALHAGAKCPAALNAILPDRWLADHPEHRLEQREEAFREARARRRRKRAARRAAMAL